MRTANRRSPSTTSSDYYSDAAENYQPASQLLPVATLDFSGFDALNSAIAQAAPAETTDQLSPAPRPDDAVDRPSSASPAPASGGGPVDRSISKAPRRTRRPAASEPDLLDVATSAIENADVKSELGEKERVSSGGASRLADAPVHDLDLDADDDDWFGNDEEADPPGRSRREPPVRRGLVKFGRKVLGLERPDKSRRPAAPHPVADQEDDPVWLQGLSEAAPTATPTKRGNRRNSRPAEDPQAGPTPGRRTRTSLSPVVDDVEVSAAPRRFTAGLWLWVARVALAVIFLAGVNQVFIKPFRTPKPAVVAATLDTAGSAQAASRYVSDYLSFLPGRGPAQLAALTNDVVGSAGAALAQWTGTGYLRVEAVLPGQVTSLDGTHSVVAVAARIHTAMPTAKTAQAAVSSPGVGADPGSVPAGWTDLGSRWITLVVPVQASGASIRVSGEGAVFAGEPPQLITEPAGAQVDQAVTTATQPVATSLLTAYALSNLSYLAAPGVSLNGLQGAVTFVSLTGWSLSLPPGATNPGAGTGVGLVTWQLAGTDLHIAQPYAIALTSSQGRWYGAALSPNPAAQ